MCSTCYTWRYSAGALLTGSADELHARAWCASGSPCALYTQRARWHCCNTCNPICKGAAESSEHWCTRVLTDSPSTYPREVWESVRLSGHSCHCYAHTHIAWRVSNASCVCTMTDAASLVHVTIYGTLVIMYLRANCSGDAACYATKC